jgi:hypothetical protein
VLQRLQTAVPVSHADGCQCLGSAPGGHDAAGHLPRAGHRSAR